MCFHTWWPISYCSSLHSPAKGTGKELSAPISLCLPDQLHLEMGRTKGKKIKIICLETWLVVKCFLFSFLLFTSDVNYFSGCCAKSQMPRTEKGKLPMTFSFPRGKTRARRNHPSHFFHYRTLALHRLQTGSVVCGSDFTAQCPFPTCIYSV